MIAKLNYYRSIPKYQENSDHGQALWSKVLQVCITFNYLSYNETQLLLYISRLNGNLMISSNVTVARILHR